ncbi:MAG: nitrate- and nitrite sensing domain-containing protein [Sulfuricurvum sp.]|nr:nitrate- and nitrite sensing domain-containing protein [Sulfuricurvum sp.]
MSFKRIGVLLLMAVVASLSSYYYFKVQTAHKTIDNIHYLNSLESFILASQKTRGLTNSYLNGNLSAQLLVYAQREKTGQAIKEMETYERNNLLNTPEQKQLISEITNLDNNAFKEDPKSVFAKYSKIIASAIHIGENLEKKMVQNDPHYKAISTIAFPLIENIGKLRGLGSGCAAHGKATPEENQELISLIAQINQLQHAMEQNDTASSTEKESMKHTFNSIQHYIQLSQDEVINRHVITLGPDFYFDQGTAVIDTIVKYLDDKQAKQIATLSS